jgi:hypothetical protein
LDIPANYFHKFVEFHANLQNVKPLIVSSVKNCFLLNEHVKIHFIKNMAKISKKGKKKEAKVAEPTSDEENAAPLPATRSSDEAIPRKVKR